MIRKIAVLSLAMVMVTNVYAKNNTRGYDDYSRVISDTAKMVGDSQAVKLAQEHGLQILDLTWEDTGRYKNSSVGPNISDMTIQIQQKNPSGGEYELTCMPVIRYPNFSDKSGDVSLDKFYLLAGNEKGKTLKKVTLREYLGNIRKYLNDSDSWKGTEKSLLAPRDTHVLVSAQACFLPIPKDGQAEFNPVLFNYQSYGDDPAVLAIIATREGTSATVIDNKRDGFSSGATWGQRLFFNQNGERASLTGKRMTDFLGSDEGKQYGNKEPGEKEGLNMVMLIQVPLKQKKPMRFGGYEDYGMVMSDSVGGYMAECKSKKSDVENAVIGHGKVEGPYTEINDLAIERDPAFPIRITVQFYKATSNGEVSESDMAQIAEQIEKVYDKADYVGSLVTGGDTNRPTEYIGDKNEPVDWWEKFWERHQENTGMSEEDSKTLWEKLFGKNRQPRQEWGLIENPVAPAE